MKHFFALVILSGAFLSFPVFSQAPQAVAEENKPVTVEQIERRFDAIRERQEQQRKLAPPTEDKKPVSTIMLKKQLEQKRLEKASQLQQKQL